jgi:predicted nucleic acid-binding protein
VEVISAIARRVRSGSLSATDGATSIAQFKTDFAGGIRVIELTLDVTARAVMLAETQALRGYDAVQLASALEVNALRLALGETALIFISADAELNAAAVAEGLTVDDPNSHP